VNRSPLVGRRSVGVAGAALALALAGCGTMSPSTITQPYDSADGVSADLSDTVGLRNVLVVGTEQGAPAVVLGTIANDGTEPVVVSLTAELAEGAQPTETRVRVPAQSGVRLGARRITGAVPFVLPALPVPPGQVVRISAATQGGGTVELNAPVLTPVNEYASITPAAPTTTPTPSPTATPSNGTGLGEGGEAGDDIGGQGEPTTEPSSTASPGVSATP
jgi:hypothetical protein